MFIEMIGVLKWCRWLITYKKKKSTNEKFYENEDNCQIKRINVGSYFKR